MSRNFLISEQQYKHLLLLGEENHELASGNHGYSLPPKLLAKLQSTYGEVKDLKNIENIDGFKRLKNILNREGILTYEWMKRIKNFFDHCGNKNDDNIVYCLNGGEPMEKWVNARLDQAQASTGGVKNDLSNIGMENSFIRYHQKNSSANPTNISDV